ncbi:cobalamin B12-binding domain-containing protein [Bacillus infantis]|jgi:MerR family transcriptional regulator, light-induced transcriptional regulator|uniref:cobalamin B12-binding domain-containing protein n=1 Tax=Bacillus infantis TaxID=324767 RepID=UPI0021559089|nr:cobalamin-dependent protein [Bacillus infantis]MCR6609856.1 cobalamin-dependent protein [Bacillus infantis]
MEQYTNQLTDALLSGDQDKAWDIIYGQHRHSANTLEIFEKLITKSMQRVGELWQNDDISVADEHLATTTCDFVLSRYRHQVSREVQPKRGRKAMFFCLENEQHFLGLKMAAIIFEEKGWETRLLGPNVPLEKGKESAEEWQPDVIGLSFTMINHAEKLSFYVKELESIKHSPAVFVGGRLLKYYDFTSHCSSKTTLLKELIDIEQWIPTLPFGEELNAR